LTNESQNYGDILQESFLDSYANLTLKSVMLLKWFTRECDKVPYVLKTDDDMYINLKQLFQLTVANKKPNLLVSFSNCIILKNPNKGSCHGILIPLLNLKLIAIQKNEKLTMDFKCLYGEKVFSKEKLNEKVYAVLTRIFLPCCFTLI
jgi:hypothetical protein